MNPYFIQLHHCSDNPDLFKPMRELHHSTYKMWIYLRFGLEEQKPLEATTIGKTIGCSRASVYSAIEELIRTNYLRPTSGNRTYDFYEEPE